MPAQSIDRRTAMPAPSSAALDAVLRHVDAGLDQSREALFSLLRIPSISAQPAHKPDCLRAAAWWRDTLAGLGFDASVRETPGHPVVVGHHAGPPGYRGPHVLFYGHYDVQPVDPLDLWTSPPFEPQLVDGPHGKRFVARGAVDDKGQTMMFARGTARLAGSRRRHPGTHYGADRGRGGSRQPQPGAVPASPTRRAGLPTSR